MSRQNDIKRLILEHNRHLQGLKEKQARYGAVDTPVFILTEIEDTEAEIDKLQAELERLGNKPELISQIVKHEEKLPKKKFNLVIISAVIMLIGIIITVALLLTPKTPSPSFSSTSTPPPTTQLSTLANTSIDDFARNITSGVGEVTKIVKGKKSQIIVIFEETHDSRLGQIEIAIMLNRLYENYGLRHIGQEGVFVTDGILNAGWFHPSLISGQVLSSKEEVVIQLLREGEISSGEALTLIYPDFQVHGTEVPVEYNIDISDEAFSAPLIYLYKIAATHITESDIAKVNDLIKANKTLEAVEFIISTDKWTNEKYTLITDNTVIVSAEDWIKFLDDIEAEANRVGADISEQDRVAMQDLREFYSKATIRSDTMATNMLNLASTYPGTSLALIIGAAHTEKVSNILTEAGVSFVVVRPESLTKDDSSELSTEAYKRKISGYSVDPIGGIGALLDNRKKPHPVLDRVWLRSKAETYLLTALVTQNNSKEHPLLSSQINSQLAQMQYVALVPDSYRLLNNNKIFSVRAQIENLSRPIEIWTRAVEKQPHNTMTLEQALEVIFLSDFIRNLEPESVTEPKIIPITSNIVAIFSTDEKIIENTTLDNAVH